jgi:1,4-alpha-glucan branching enzyme
MISVRFTFLTGLKRALFQNARLSGSWDGWSAELPMDTVVGEDGCLAFTAVLELDDDRAGEVLRWGVRFDGPNGANTWGINLEVHDMNSLERTRQFTLPGPGESAEAQYHFTYSRRLGAQKMYAGGAEPGIRFSVWAPNAQGVEVVFGRRDNGYISDDGDGIDPNRPVIPLQPTQGGIRAGSPTGKFSDVVGLPYMFRVKNAQDEVVYRTDLHSRWQTGRGWMNPKRTTGTVILIHWTAASAAAW